jgi:F0F1-type ATP synthase membrane subunit c/vacuolar-type H+-ATPase subunit K
VIRAQFILGAAFAEGLGVLAIVVAILAIVLQPAAA